MIEQLQRALDAARPESLLQAGSVRGEAPDDAFAGLLAQLQAAIPEKLDGPMTPSRDSAVPMQLISFPTPPPASPQPAAAPLPSTRENVAVPTVSRPLPAVSDPGREAQRDVLSQRLPDQGLPEPRLPDARVPDSELPDPRVTDSRLPDPRVPAQQRDPAPKPVGLPVERSPRPPRSIPPGNEPAVQQDPMPERGVSFAAERAVPRLRAEAARAVETTPEIEAEVRDARNLPNRTERVTSSDFGKNAPVQSAEIAVARPKTNAPVLASEPQRRSEAGVAQDPVESPVPRALPLVQTAPLQRADAAPGSPPVAASGPPETIVPARVEWLAARGGGSARVVLHPAELGEVEISVRVRGESVEVVIRADEPVARTALLAAREQLDLALASRELRVESLEIRSSAERPAAFGSEAGGGGRNETFEEAHADGGRQRHDGRGEATDRAPQAEPAAANLRTSAAASRRVDLHV